MKISIILPAVLVFVGCASEPVVQRAETLPSAVTRIEDSWVQLFDGPNFTGRSLTVKYPMDILTLREVATDDGIKGFEDKASSVFAAGAQLRHLSRFEFRRQATGIER